MESVRNCEMGERKKEPRPHIFEAVGRHGNGRADGRRTLNHPPFLLYSRPLGENGVPAAIYRAIVDICLLELEILVPPVNS